MIMWYYAIYDEIYSYQQKNSANRRCTRKDTTHRYKSLAGFSICTIVLDMGYAHDMSYGRE